jgi:outer membrane protein OmpA-like peptidoglycan-associated protein
MMKKAFLLIPVIVLALPCGFTALAADLPGAKDHPLLKRFGGSEIVGYQVKRFDEYDLQTSSFKGTNLSSYKREFVKPPLKVEGKLTRIWYEAAGDASSSELIRNYQNELRARGFQILYDSGQDPGGIKGYNFLAPFSRMDIKTNRSTYVFFAANDKTARSSSARLKRAEGDVYVYMIAVEWPKDDKVYKARRGAYLAVDIIEVKPMTQNMVTVSADEMSRAITSSGRVALYGIFFDTNRAEIKPESRPALEQIARLLKKEPRMRLHVVGHTDNVGGYESNMSLSRRRAESVVAALTRQYGIASNRLTANGVAYLAPVAVNTTEDGRAKNRRVELVPR